MGQQIGKGTILQSFLFVLCVWGWGGISILFKSWRLMFLETSGKFIKISAARPQGNYFKFERDY